MIASAKITAVADPAALNVMNLPHRIGSKFGKPLNEHS
jgi:hypothetical protein